MWHVVVGQSTAQVRPSDVCLLPASDEVCGGGGAKRLSKCFRVCALVWVFRGKLFALVVHRQCRHTILVDVGVFLQGAWEAHVRMLLLRPVQSRLHATRFFLAHSTSGGVFHEGWLVTVRVRPVSSALGAGRGVGGRGAGPTAGQLAGGMGGWVDLNGQPENETAKLRGYKSRGNYTRSPHPTVPNPTEIAHRPCLRRC